MGPIRDRLGPVMLQFEYLNRQKMASPVEFFERLAQFAGEVADECNLAVELRNPNYLGQTWFALLDEHKVTPVFCQGYYMPPVVDVYARVSELVKRGAVIRLMGPDRKAVEGMARGRWNRIVDHRDDELKGVLEMVRELLAHNVPVYVNVNNHNEGSSPLTMEKIRQAFS